MKKKEFLILYFSIFLLGLFFNLSLFQKEAVPAADTVMINRLVKQTQINWNRLSKESYPATDYAFKVIDNSGRTLYSTGGITASSYDESINEATANYDIMLDIIIENQVAGKLIIHNETDAGMKEMQHKLRKYALYFYFIMALLMLFYYVYLDRKLLRPFQSLQKFASSVAAGNLEVPVKMDKKNMFGAYTESFDLMREALKTARQNEYLANKSKKELVASLSHDIKNPVASIQAVCETMALDFDDERIAVILQKAEQIDALISDMFHATLEELQELKVHKEEFTSSVIAGIIESINYYKKIKLLSPIPECLICMDRLRFTQVVENVAANTNKYAKTDMHFSFELSEKYLIIRIKDFGPGVAEEELPMICEKFYRGKNAEGREGAGLGLYLSRLFMEKMGGQLECLNDSGGFTVMIGLRLVGNNGAN